MKIRVRRWPVLLAVTVFFVLIASFPPIRWCAMGIVKNERFCHGWPTSYWSMRAAQHMGPHPDDYVSHGDSNGFWARFRRACGFEDPPQFDPPFGQPPPPEAIPVLIELLDDTNDQVCFYACNALTQARSHAGEAVPKLLKLIKHRSVYHRRNAINALWAIGPEPILALPTLIEALNDADDIGWVNAAAAGALGDMGPRASEAVPALLELLRSKKATLAVPFGLPGRKFTVSDYALDALEKIDPEAGRKVKHSQKSKSAEEGAIPPI